MRLSTRGFSELNRKLASLQPGKQKASIGAAQRFALNPLKSKFRKAAPKGKTKQLSRSAKVKKQRTRKGEVAATVAAMYSPVAHLVSRGTRKRETKAGKSRGAVKGNDFIGRIADASENETIARFEEKMVKEIDKRLR